MKGYTSDNIRNVALLGHSGSGKTTFLEAALAQTGAIDKMGSIDKGTTVSDYDKIEKEKGYSINATVAPVEYKNVKINFIDTPGYFDFVGEVNAALTAAEAAIILVDAGAGIQVGTEKAWKVCEQYGTPRFIVLSRKEGDEYDFEKTFGELKEKFGDALTAFDYPLSGDIDDDLMEAIASSDDALMEKFFEGEEFSADEIKTGLKQGIQSGEIVPVCTTPFEAAKSCENILGMLVDCAPSAADHKTYKGLDDNGETIELESKPDGAASGFVFKTINDPFAGKISLIKVVCGQLKAGEEMLNERTENAEKLGKLFTMRGNRQEDIDSAPAGDIAAVAKLQYTLSGDTLCDKKEPVEYVPPAYPTPKLYTAIEAAEKKQEDKVFSGLARLREEDPSFTIERNNETKQTLLGVQGEQQMNVIMEKLKDRFGVEVKTIPQKIAYRETIRGTSDVQGKHKKQSGGAGQYGDVHIKFSPCDADFEFEETLFGGSVPKNYVPAIEKGLVESMEKGPLAGCKVQGVHANLYDGSYHEVDSNEMAFKIAASLAFKKGIVEASPCLLEPIMHLVITVPDENMGDIMGDMNKRRGRILGSEPLSSGDQKIIAEAPQAELFDYAITVRSMTQGRGSFDMNFDRYDPMPQQLADKVIENYKAEQEANK
ncbi:MAG: elongation factor G [Anaerovoracaceae bacterium]|jgi:elongation factor G